MRKGYNILTIGIFLFLITFFGFSPFTIVGVNENTSIQIRALPENQFSVTQLNLLPDTTYTIYFWNPVENHFHNLIIATNGRTITPEIAVLGAISTDLVIGKTDLSTVTDEDFGGPDKGMVGSITWTTPKDNMYVSFFCSCPGHFGAGMKGYFTVGNPIGPPPFKEMATLSELIFAIAFVLVAVLALPVVALAIAFPLDRKFRSITSV
ncbi:MAG: hypothetical protein ACFFE8_05720 [Candidatus Heimdallarchaeota archaeon]